MFNVYIYQAALLCDECGEKARSELTMKAGAAGVPVDPSDERSYDSDDFPTGPYPDGGGEADCPQHCDECKVFLENPLTYVGLRYVSDRLAHPAWEDSKEETEWRDFYSVASKPLPAFTSLGGYPLIYLAHNGFALCGKCAALEVKPCVAGVHWEGPSVFCEECGVDIESAYGDPDDEKGGTTD